MHAATPATASSQPAARTLPASLCQAWTVATQACLVRVCVWISLQLCLPLLTLWPAPPLPSGAPGECGNLTIPAAASCPANCSYPTGGACLADGTCQCKPSFFGVDCTSQYCEGNTVLEVAPFQAHQPSQPGRLPSFQPSPTGSFMRYRSRCSWLLSVIDPATGQQPSHGHITLDWSEFGTNQGSVYVYNGNSTAKDHLLRQFTSVPVFQPARNEAEVIGPVMSIVPQLTVVVQYSTKCTVLQVTPPDCTHACVPLCLVPQLQADALSFTPCVGFVANYTAGCLPSCSSPGGYCDNGRCVCKYGWYGIDCSLPMCRELAIITPQDERGTPAEQHMIQDHRHPLPGALLLQPGMCRLPIRALSLTPAIAAYAFSWDIWEAHAGLLLFFPCHGGGWRP